MPLVDFETFKKIHLEALETNQARHNFLLGNVARAEKNPTSVKFWSFGEGARAATLQQDRYLILGDLQPEDCIQLASEIEEGDLRGCLGCNEVPGLFVEAIEKRGIRMELEMPQRIMQLNKPPIFPASPGRGRLAQKEDLPRFCDWMIAFCLEAQVPEGPPDRLELLATGFWRPVFFWEVDDQAVAMASITRETKDAGNISLVYTPPEFRGKGYAGSITAHTCQEIFSSGKKMAVLGADLRNPVSNRVYEKIGFVQTCEFFSYRRK